MCEVASFCAKPEVQAFTPRKRSALFTRYVSDSVRVIVRDQDVFIECSPKAGLRWGKCSFLKLWGDWTEIPAVPPLCLLWLGSWIRREGGDKNQAWEKSSVYSALYFQSFLILAPACWLRLQPSEGNFCFLQSQQFWIFNIQDVSFRKHEVIPLKLIIFFSASCSAVFISFFFFSTDN